MEINGALDKNPFSILGQRRARTKVLLRQSSIQDSHAGGVENHRPPVGKRNAAPLAHPEHSRLVAEVRRATDRPQVLAG